MALRADTQTHTYTHILTLEQKQFQETRCTWQQAMTPGLINMKYTVQHGVVATLSDYAPKYPQLKNVHN